MYSLYHYCIQYNTVYVLSGALRKRSTGEITNLMSVDSNRLQTLTPYLHAIWYSFIQIALALYFLWSQLGPACLAGKGLAHDMMVLIDGVDYSVIFKHFGVCVLITVL